MILSLAMSTDDSLPNDVETLRAMLIAERAARLAAESEAQNRALLIEKLKYTIRKLRHERFGQSSERGSLLDQLELQLADLEEDASQAEVSARLTAAATRANDRVTVASFERRKPARRPLPEHLPRERLSGARDLPVLRWADLAQDRGGPDRDARAHPTAVEGDPARAGEVLLPILGSDYPAAGAL